MGDTHWSEDELIGRLYGVGPEGDHPDRCPECGERLRRLTGRRQQLLRAEGAVRPGRLARQLHAVEERAARPPAWRPWPAVALAGGLMVAAFVYDRPRPAPQPPAAAAAAETRLFEEVFEEVARSEPRALDPVQALFEVKR